MKIRLSKTPSRRASAATEIDVLGEGAARTVNLLRSGGRFAPAVRAVLSDFPDCPPGASAAYYSQGSGALFVLVGDSAYRLEKGGSEYSKLADLHTDAPFFVDMCVSGSPAAVLVDGSDAIVCNGAGADAAECPHAFFAGTEHCGRFFGRDLTDGHVVRWAASHILDWEEGIDGCGYARLPAAGGDVLGLFGFRDRLVAVRERGVTVMRAYGDPQNYKVDDTAGCVTADGVIAATCAMCGGKILFCTGGGLYAFDGSDAERLADFVSAGISAPQFAAACGDRYYLVCTENELGQGCLYCYDLPSGAGTAADIYPDALFAGPRGVCAVCASRVYDLVPGGTGEWISPAVHPGGAAHAFADSVLLSCSGNVVLTVTADGASRTFHGAGRHRVAMGGRAFGFSVRTDGVLRGLTLTAEV